MTPQIAEIIGRANQPSKLAELLERLRLLVSMSRDEMCKYYDQWDQNDMVYRGERKPDLQDHQAKKRGEPVKITLPLTFGQVQTFVAFGHTTYNSRDYFYEMNSSGAEDEAPGNIASALLEQNLHHNKFRGPKLTQLLTDIARFGLGVTKETWVQEDTPIVEDVPDPAAVAKVQQGLIQPVNIPTVKKVSMVPKYHGNKVVNVSPYRWFPDVRIPLSRWEEGEFAADEIEEPVSRMKELEKTGVVAGIEYVPQLPNEAFSNRRLAFMRKDQAMSAPYSGNPHYYLLTEVQIKLNPAQTEIDDGVFLDPERDVETLYVVWILNDGRIVRIDEAGYNHERFGYNAAQLFDDQNRFINFSLCDLLSAVQDTSTWLLNSHITAVRKSVFPQFVGDPAAIHVEDLEARSPFIRTRAGRAGAGIDQWIKQLPIVDNTANHTNDVGILSGMAKEATGINDTLLGQISSGRRSAREMGNVSQSAAARLVVLFYCIWESCLGPQGEKMLSNLRQGLDVDTVVRVYGNLNTQQAAQPDLPGLPPPLFRLIKVQKRDLVGNFDFAPFNGTQPSQRMQTAGILQQILKDMQADPRLVLMTGLDPKLLFFEVLNLLNIRNVQRFQLTPARLGEIMQLAQPPGNAGGSRNSQRGGQGANGGGGQPRPAA